jgi:hypothetical protein
VAKLIGLEPTTSCVTGVEITIGGDLTRSTYGFRSDANRRPRCLGAACEQTRCSYSVVTVSVILVTSTPPVFKIETLCCVVPPDNVNSADS